MNNDLKNFLEGERKDTINSLFYSDPDLPLVEQIIQDHDTRLINFILDLVEKEVEKKKQYGETKDAFELVLSTKDISTIINNLRV